MSRHPLTDEEWDCIADIFPMPAQTGRPPRDRRLIVNAILWILRTGSPWRDLPEEYQPWGTVWDLFDTWNDDGTLDDILHRRQRNIIERLIGWLKENRRIFTRFEKTAKNFAGMLKMAFIHRYLRLTYN